MFEFCHLTELWHTDADGSDFPLERYLEKVVAIHSCRVLIKFAHSPRLRHHFHNKSFEIRIIPSIIRRIPPPSQLGKLIAETLHGQDLETSDHVRLDDIANIRKK